MAEKKKIQQKKVKCMDCKNEIRDTEGISHNAFTGEFFLCRCKKGHDRNKFDQLAKLFIDEERFCNDFEHK